MRNKERTKKIIETVLFLSTHAFSFYPKEVPKSAMSLRITPRASLGSTRKFPFKTLFYL